MLGDSLGLFLLDVLVDPALSLDFPLVKPLVNLLNPIPILFAEQPTTNPPAVQIDPRTNKRHTKRAG